MTKRWKNRPAGSNWGEFGEDDQHGRMNLLTAERRLRALQEVKTGEVFCLSHPLDRPGGNVLNANRYPPVFHPVMRGKDVYFNLAMENTDPRFTDVGSDEAIMLYSQYSTHWDGFAHKGTVFDANGDGVPEKVSYNGFQLVDSEGHGTQGELGALALSVAEMAQTGVQGRAVMIDLRHHFGDERVAIRQRQSCSLDRLPDPDADNRRPDNLAALLHRGISALHRDRQNWRLRPDRHNEAAFLERQQLGGFAARPLGKYQERVAAANRLRTRLNRTHRRFLVPPVHGDKPADPERTRQQRYGVQFRLVENVRV